MKLSDKTITGETLLDKLVKSFSGGRAGLEIALPLNPVQQSPLIASDIERIFGTNDEFIARYRQLEDTAYELMRDSRNLKQGVGSLDIDLMRKMGKMDLSVFNYETKSFLMTNLRDQVLKFDTLLSEVGIPGMEFPSENLYSTLTKFDVNQTERTNHAAMSFLQRTFFNVNPNKEGKLAFNFGISNLLTSDALERVAYQQSSDFVQLGDMMTLDVETTSVMKGSQVRSFADRVSGVDGKLVSEYDVAFENLQMATTRVRTPDGVRRLMSEGVNILENSHNIKSMDDGGLEFVQEFKKLFKRINDPNIKHLSGHNIFFDLQKLVETAQGLGAYDEEARDLIDSAFTRIANEKTFLVDTKETLSSYFR
jgi:hypothetical protein